MNYLVFSCYSFDPVSHSLPVNLTFYKSLSSHTSTLQCTQPTNPPHPLPRIRIHTCFQIHMHVGSHKLTPCQATELMWQTPGYIETKIQRCSCSPKVLDGKLSLLLLWSPCPPWAHFRALIPESYKVLAGVSANSTVCKKSKVDNLLQ